jgi:hypothetical protein
MKIWNQVALALLSTALIGISDPKPAHAGNVTNAVLACYVDTFAFDNYTNNICSSIWTPSSANDPTLAVFEVFGLTAGSYTFTWTNLETGTTPAGCGNSAFCTISIGTDVSGDGISRASVLIRDNATGATKTVSARARYFDGYH